ncbi:caspase family protein [Raineyella fluvialis]|uniref:Peptidase C14 caspase domain-containing protein n=1 Tax=Raineyella fluvialis TaxID=2662261 RepID=A0A5Q2FCF1_9ACTN|nr:caspase family protein [Raineyella fluvialis]QGF24071.1 hypothetical protein Rai3103_10695 [Raineyella fluvialis]
MTAARVTIPSPALPAGARSALVVATTTYQDPQLGRLRAPATDAADLAAVLADPTIGGFQVTTVMDRPAQDVRVAVEDFLANRGPDELVVVYLSCHGVIDAHRRLYFAATDTVRTRLASTGVDSQWVNERMDDCRARRQVLVLDCCFSGAFARAAKGEEALGLDQLAQSGRGRAVLTASNDREYSFESTADARAASAEPSPGSVFTAALVAGLRDGGADADGDGFISVDEAYGYAYGRVRASGAAQTPQRWLSGGEGEILLARNPAGRTISPAPVPDALRTALDSPLPDVREAAVHTLGRWLTSGEPAQTLAATRELAAVADNDIPRIAAVARAALGAEAGAERTGTSPPATTSVRKHPHLAIPAGRRKRIIGAVAIVLVVGVVLATVLLRGGFLGTGSKHSSVGAAQILVPSMLTVDDVRQLDTRTVWTSTLSQDWIGSDTPAPVCLAFSDPSLPTPQAAAVRRFQGGPDQDSYVLDVAMQFASDTEAASTADVLLRHMGACDQPGALLERGWNVTGAGDAAAGVSAIIQDKSPVHHTVQVGRTGKVLHILDASQPSVSPDGGRIVGLLAAVIGRACAPAAGTCPDNPSASPGVPPRTALDPQFLAPGDLPRITATTGRWAGTDVSTSFPFFGSQCEGKNLATVPGPQDRRHRSYLLKDDAAAPQGGFGVDEYILAFPDSKGADALAKDVGASIDGCATSIPTAKVEKGDTIDLKAGNATLSGRTWTVTQQVDPNARQKYRLALVQLDRNVVYLLAPTGSSFDFSDAQWKAVAVRAGERVTNEG